MNTLTTHMGRALPLVVALALIGRSSASAVDCSQTSCTDSNRSWTDRPNILLVITDDHAFCHWGFMGGRCQSDANRECNSTWDCSTCAGGPNPGKLCATNGDCTPGICTFDRCVANNAGDALRLNDVACRNREVNRETKGPKGHFPYDRLQNPKSPVSRAPRTPYFDELATHGAVFPRAHVGALSCSTSRNVIHLGKFLSHVGPLPKQDVFPAIGKQLKVPLPATDQPDCSQATVTDAQLPGWTCDPPYKAGGFAKMGGLSENGGGFDDGNGAQQIGKYHCPATDASNCTNCCSSKLRSCYASSTRSTVPDPACADVPRFELLDQNNPKAKIQGLVRIINFIEGGAKGAIDKTNHKRLHPFYIWFGPNIPHANAVPESYFENEYFAGRQADEGRHMGRVSWVDSDVGGLMTYLKETCICSRTKQRQTLYDSTVVIVLADQAWMMPNAKAVLSENTQRTPILVNAPEHRSEPAKPFPNEFAHSIDVMPTILDYAGVLKKCTTSPCGTVCANSGANCASTGDCSTVGGACVQQVCAPEQPGLTIGTGSTQTIGICRTPCSQASDCTAANASDFCYCTDGTCVLTGTATCDTAHGKTCVCGYPFARDLRPYIDLGPASAPPIRQIQFTEGKDPSVSLTIRPGLVGVCSGGQGDTILYPCLVNDDCHHTDINGHHDQDYDHGATCLLPKNGHKACANSPPNNPTHCTDTDNQCISGLCSGMACQGGGASFFDLVGVSCSSDLQCVPADPCRPLILKVVGNGNATNPGGKIVDMSTDPSKPIKPNAVAYDMGADPDENDDLLRRDPKYLGVPGDGHTLREKLEKCLRYFRGDPTAQKWAPDGVGCPDLNNN